MKAVLQRVSGAVLCVDGEKISEIAEGLVVYFGVAKGDDEAKVGAEAPDRAKTLYEYAGKLISGYGINVKYGVFGADMRIAQNNSGPVTIIWEC